MGPSEVQLGDRRVSKAGTRTEDKEDWRRRRRRGVGSGNSFLTSSIRARGGRERSS